LSDAHRSSSAPGRSGRSCRRGSPRLVRSGTRAGTWSSPREARFH
jgi:hypothetical protein